MAAMDIHQRDDLAFPNRSPNFRSYFPMTRRVPPILDVPVGLTVLSARIVV
jgi:hypothetical protein